jgi:predicted choloylglycine hydrolase
MQHFRRSLFVAALFAVLVTSAAARAEPYRFPTGKYRNAELKYVGGLPVLVVSGTPEEIGEAVGVLAMKPDLKVLDYPRDLIKEFGAESLYPLILRSGTMMYDRFPADYKTELDAMAKGAGISKEQLIVGNTLFDVKKLVACSALLVDPERSATGGALLGRNLDYPSLDNIQEHGLVTIYRPKGKHAFASVGFPGLMGVVSGMNDAGLTVAILEVMQIKDGEKRFDIEGTPYALCYRTLLQECTTIAEAKKMLSGMRRTTTTNLVLADRTGVAVFEVSPGKVVQRDPLRGVCACTNHYCTDEVRPNDAFNYARTFDRLRLLEDARDIRDRITVADVHKRLDAANLGIFTLQTMIFEPKTLKLHLAMGEIPASRGPLRSIDLAPLFKGE